MGCSPKRFSRPPRCDRFDTPPCPSIISVFYAPVNRLIRARLRFVLRRTFPLFFCPLLSSPICRNAFARVLLFVESFPSPLFAFYRRHVPRCFRSRFDLCRLYLSLFPAPASARARFAVRALTANRSALKNRPAKRSGNYPRAKNKTNPRIGQIRQYRGIFRQRK